MLYSQKKLLDWMSRANIRKRCGHLIRTQAVCGLWEIITARVVSRVSYRIFCWGGHMATHASPSLAWPRPFPRRLVGGAGGGEEGRRVW